jgi:hypothetical protein
MAKEETKTKPAEEEKKKLEKLSKKYGWALVDIYL